MLLVHFESQNLSEHLACDEILLQKVESGELDETLRFYEIRRPTVVIGVGGELLPVVYSRTLAAVADIVDARSNPTIRTIRERRALCVGYALGEDS